MSNNSDEMRLKGTPICRGVAIGSPFYIVAKEEIIPEFNVGPEGVEEEVYRYRRALNYSYQDIQKLQIMLAEESLTEGVSLLEAQLQMIQDPSMTTDIETAIARSQKNAESVFQHQVSIYKKNFQSLQDPFFRERFSDIQDLFKRVMRYLCARSTTLSNMPPQSILIAHELSVTDVVEANMNGVYALLTVVGSPTSHAAIMAKAKGTPYISNINLESLKHSIAGKIIVDGRTGDVIINPSSTTLFKYQETQKNLQIESINLKQLSELQPHTMDGHSIKLTANIAMPNEIDFLHQQGGNGVGLFRSEYLFLSNETFLTEEEQFTIYSKMAQKMKGLPFVIRTFDLGGDKKFSEHASIAEENPSLGCRAIRHSLKERGIFKTQLRAILRASASGNIRILFPFISTLSELLETKAILNEVKKELVSREIIIADDVKIGCMIEVPSAALISDLLAEECDFLSIGTNDLTQYTLAADRNNHAVNFLNTPAHPSVLRLLKWVSKEAKERNTPVTICGEVAADPRFTPLLLGLGIQELSVSACHIPTIKNVIRKMNFSEAQRLTQYVMTLKTAEEVLETLSNHYKRVVPDDSLYNCSESI